MGQSLILPKGELQAVRVAVHAVQMEKTPKKKKKDSEQKEAPPALTAANNALSAMQQQMLDGLKGKSGTDFDAAYAAAQVAAHQATLDALSAYAASGDNAALQEMAKGLVPTVTAHLNMAKGLK